jgi:hypothetical protein
VTSAGVKTLTATYSGDANFTAGNSGGVLHTVNPSASFSGATATGTGTANASVSGAGCTFTNAQFVQAPQNGPNGVNFPHGLFDFTVGGCGAGATATVQVTFPQAFPPGTQYWKYGPTPGPSPAHWYSLASGAPNNLVINGNTATFTITDGGLGDDDLTANGIIVDQGGPGISGIGNTGGNNAKAVPTLNEWGVLLLSCMLILVNFRVMRTAQLKENQRK